MRTNDRRRSPAGYVRIAAVVLLALSSTGAQAGDEIVWDRYGVPHVFASTERRLFQGFGLAQMQSHRDLILRLYGTARGRAAEYWGERYRDSDRWVRINGIPERANRWYAQQTPQFRANLEAFAAGLNQAAAASADTIPADLRVVLPITPVDVLAHTQRVVSFSFLVQQGAIDAMLKARPAPPTSAGSNGWAIAPKRTAGGRALLLANPHLLWSDMTTFYEAHLNGPGVNLYGAALVGFPVIGIGFNDHLGWTHTVNPHDGADLFELTPAPDGGYVFDGAARPFVTRTETIKIKGADGAVTEETFTVKESLHGPVVGERNGHPIALRIAGLDQPGVCQEWWDMGRATSLNRFVDVLKRLAIPMFNVVYADRRGHIMEVYNARVPARPPGAHDWARVVAGDTSATLWTRTLAFDELPRVTDPASGWLQNSNDPPWTMTMPRPLDPAKFAPYLAPRTLSWRARRSIAILTAQSAWTLDRLQDEKFSTRVQVADRVLDELIAEGRKANDPALAPALDVLAQWDRTTDAKSRGAVLFLAFAQRWFRMGDNLFRVNYDERRPVETPSGLANAAGTLDALRAAAEDVRKRYGALDPEFGRVYRLRAGATDLPANGWFGDPFGIVHAVGYLPARDGTFQANMGDSFVAAIEFSTPVRARAVLPYGNSSQPDSPHRFDQLKLFASKQLRPVWNTPALARSNAHRVERY